MAKKANKPEWTLSAKSVAKLTILTTDHGILTKECALDSVGHLKKTTTPNFASGSYKVVVIRNLKEFQRVRNELSKAQALMYSTPINGNTFGRITTKERRQKIVLSRTNDCFSHPREEAIIALDYDNKPDNPPLTQKQLIAALQSAFPALKDTQLLWATSAGSCIYHQSTGYEYAGVTGQRVYFMVQNGSDISRAMKVVDQRLWLAGYGWIKVSKSGRKLKRSLIDLALANSVQPDFAAGASCQPPLTQRPQQHLIGSGDAIDTRAAMSDLTADERKRLLELYVAAENEAEPAAKAARESWLEAYVQGMVQRAHVAGNDLNDEEKQENRNAALSALDKGLLAGDFLIKLAGGAEITVAEILKHPAKYHGTLCCDPLEPDYDEGRLVAKIFTNRKPSIHSFARGGQVFKLVRQPTEVEWHSADSAISVEKTLEVLRSTGNFFDYGNAMVHIEGSDIHVLTAATAVHYVGLVCRFWFWKTSRDGKTTKVNCDPPEKLVKQLLDLGIRRGLRKLTATSDVPLILPTGRVIAENGYDTETGILVVSDENFPIPGTPSMEDVRQVLKTLWHPFSQFPYADASARTNCLAALLTAAIRKVVPTALGIAIDAPQRGTGKTKLLSAIMALHCGRYPDLSPLPMGSARDEELRKKITTTLLEGRDHVFFDNIIGNFDSLVLAALITSGHWADRILGKSSEFKGVARLMVGVNGNNLTLAGDLVRRFLQIRLDAGTENPFARHFDYDPVELVLSSRDQLIAAAITGIKGWFAAGAPGVASAGVGSFEDWGKLVRGPLRWFADNNLLPFEGFVDPLETLTTAVENDPDQEDLGQFLSALDCLLAGKEASANDLLVMRNQVDLNNEDKILVFSYFVTHTKSELTAKNMGKVLSNRRDRVANGMKLVMRKNRKKIGLFSVVKVANC